MTNDLKITTETNQDLQTEYEAISACLAVLPIESPAWESMQDRAMTILTEIVRRNGTLWRADWAKN